MRLTRSPASTSVAVCHRPISWACGPRRRAPCSRRRYGHLHESHSSTHSSRRRTLAISSTTSWARVFQTQRPVAVDNLVGILACVVGARAYRHSSRRLIVGTAMHGVRLRRLFSRRRARGRRRGGHRYLSRTLWARIRHRSIRSRAHLFMLVGTYQVEPWVSISCRRRRMSRSARHYEEYHRAGMVGLRFVIHQCPSRSHPLGLHHDTDYDTPLFACCSLLMLSTIGHRSGLIFAGVDAGRYILMYCSIHGLCLNICPYCPAVLSGVFAGQAQKP